jgi:hypothetical protein
MSSLMISKPNIFYYDRQLKDELLKAFLDIKAGKDRWDKAKQRADLVLENSCTSSRINLL